MSHWWTKLDPPESGLSKKEKILRDFEKQQKRDEDINDVKNIEAQPECVVFGIFTICNTELDFKRFNKIDSSFDVHRDGSISVLINRFSTDFTFLIDGRFRFDALGSMPKKFIIFRFHGFPENGNLLDAEVITSGGILTRGKVLVKNLLENGVL